jgi:4-amino-4-deoxy-L-arabinose transferase-like glycosyltransferase
MVLLLALLCLNLRILNFVGIGINDDIAYIQNAKSLAEGNSPIKSGFNQLGFRLGMVFPLAVLYHFFGYDEKGFCLYPIACSVLTCALIYLTAIRIWSMRAAVFACLLQITYPLQVVFGTQLSPSNQHATCVAAALFFYFYATKKRDSDLLDDLPQAQSSSVTFLSKLREPALLTLCGVFIGFGWMINVLIVTIALTALPVFIIVRPKIKDLMWILAGFALVFAVELLIVKIECGSWFARISCILKTEAAVDSNVDMTYFPRALFKIWNTNPLQAEGHFGIIWYLFILITVLALFFKDKIALALSLGCWFWIAWMQWGVQSPQGDPIAKYIRYVSMIVPVQCLAFGGVFWHLTRFSKVLTKVIIVLFALLLIHLSWMGVKAVKAVKVHTADFKEITRLLMHMSVEEHNIIYTDDLTGNFIELYSKGTLNVFKVNHKTTALPVNGFLVADGSWYAVKLEEYRQAMPQWSLSPPEYWTLISTINGEKAGEYGEFDPKIYRIVPPPMERDPK